MVAERPGRVESILDMTLNPKEFEIYLLEFSFVHLSAS
jgi:hypothetical protein